MIVDLNPKPAPLAAQEYGPGIRRLDPGTVNLPLGVGPPARSFAEKWSSKVLVVWIRNAHRKPRTKHS